MINRLVIENLKHRPIRTLLTVLAIGLQVTMILTLVGLSRGTIESSATRARGVGADVVIRPPNSSAIGLSSAPIPEKMLDFVAKQPHVKIATGVVVHSLQLFDTVSGVDLQTFEKMSGGLVFLEGGPFRGNDQIIVDQVYAQQHNWHVGDTVTLLNRPMKVTGIVQPGKLARVMMPLQELQQLTANTGSLSMIYVKLDDPKLADGFVKSLNDQLPKYQIYTMDYFLSLVSVDNVPLLRQFIRVVIGLSIAFGFLVVFLAMYTAVLERTREVGILKALGASPTFILRIMLRETVAIAITGAIIGILLTFGTQGLINHAIGASLNQVTVPDWWPIATAIAIIGAVIGATYPALRAARQDAIEALSYE